ncbi:helix-turn-helix domain-containing protein [Clostridium acetireducens]|nr:helix-turn-helix domain-containing protein [Clostridium acetireducens]
MSKYTLMENKILNKKISSGAFKLYFILSSYCFGEKNICFPSQKYLAKKLDKSTRTVQRYTKELRECGLIEIEKGRRGINNYKVMYFKKSIYKNVVNKNKNFSKKNKSNVFCSFPQRSYDFEALEKKLLGWE